MFGKGFKYGMLLQLAIGPVCMLVFRTAGAVGLIRTIPQILGVALVDAAFLTLAGAGTVALLKNPKIQTAVRIIGAAVLLIFGAATVLDGFGLSFLPGIDVTETIHTQGIFLQGVLLTASNPMTILFWNSLLTAQTAKERMGKAQTAAFGAGCVMSTVVFLTLIAIAGSLIDRFLPLLVTRTVTVIVGIAMIVYAATTLFRRRAREEVVYAKD